MSIVGDRTHYLSLDQIEAVCGAVEARLLVGSQAVVDALRRELMVVSANGLRTGALGQGQFGPHAARPGVVTLAGPGGVGKTFFAELIARAAYGERYAEHLIHVNCRSYFAGRLPPLPQATLDRGPLTVVTLDGVEVLPQLPPVAALWADALRYGRAAIPAANPQGTVLQLELSFARCLVVATANVGRDLVTHIGFRPRTPPATADFGSSAASAPEIDTAHGDAVRLIEEALATLFDGDLADVLDVDRWLILPPLDERGMRRLVELRLGLLGDLLPRGSPPIVISDPAVQRMIARTQEASAPNKTAALVDLLERTVEPAVNAALLRSAAPLPLAVRIDLEGDAVVAHVEPASRG